MSQYGSLIVPVTAPPEPDDGVHGFVKLEEGPVDSYRGYLTKLQTVAYINHLLLKTAAPNANCDEVGLSRFIYAYPSRPGLGFRVGTSRGVIVSRGLEPYEKEEILQVNMETAVSLDNYPGQVQAIWEGDVFDDGGTQTAPPPISSALPKPVYGTILVKYSGYRHVYELTAEPDSEAYENALQTLVYAVWPGGVNGLEVTVPDGAEAGDCNNRIGDFDPNDGTLDVLPPDIPRYVNGEDTDHQIDYCTLEEV